MILTSMARRIAPNADRSNFFTRRPPRKIPRQAQGIAVIPLNTSIKKNKQTSRFQVRAVILFETVFYGLDVFVDLPT